MEYLKNKLLVLFLLTINVAFGQFENISSSLKDFEGIWKFIPSENSSDTSFTSIDVISNKKRLNIFYWHDSKSLSLNYDMIGFVAKDKMFNRLSDLVDDGFRMFSFNPNPFAPNDSIKYLKGGGRYFLALYNGIAGEELFDPPAKGFPNYFTFNFNGRENEYHRQIHHIPNQIISALCRNKAEKIKVEVFLNIKYGIVKTTKSFLTKAPNQTTKMYLLKNDPVEVIEEKDNWLKIKYYPEKNGEWTGKTIEGWIKKSDVE
jgi:hypothetical protein